MFHKLLTYSTMTAVVLHALLGCCVHHAHAVCTHDHGDESVVVEVPHIVGLSGADHDHVAYSFEHQAGSKDVCPDEPCSESPCSGSHDPHESCEEADCNFVADQHDNDLSLLLNFDWLPLLTYSLSLSSQELSALRMEAGSPPDPHSVLPPLRVKTQVWRL